jgi:hypothetical protein
VDGVHDQENTTELISACIRQGVSFAYTHVTYNELAKRRDAAIAALNKFSEEGSAHLTEKTLLTGKIEVREGFANQYYRYKRANLIASPEDYRLKLMTDFNLLKSKFKFEELRHNSSISEKEVDMLAKFLKEEKKARGASSYTGWASKVDAYNILLTRQKRGRNFFNFSDVKCFYLTDVTQTFLLALCPLPSVRPYTIGL